PPPRPALGKTIPYDQYQAAVDGALSDVRAARSLSGSERTRKLQSAATTLEGVEGAGVSIHGGEAPAEIDNTAITGELRSTSPDVDAVERSLASLSEGLRQAGQGGVIAGTADGE